MTSVLWLRRDLRRNDHPALRAAADEAPVAALFVLDPKLYQRASAPRRAWLAATLLATQDAYDGSLCVRVGDPRVVVPRFAHEVGARSVHVSAETFPKGRRRDAQVRAALSAAGVAWVETGCPYAVAPGGVRTPQGRPYGVFTPFARAWRRHGWDVPEPAPSGLTLIAAPSDDAVAQRLRQDALNHGLQALPPAGEGAALARWHAFLGDCIDAYSGARDRPDLAATSGLSPHLKLGSIHPRTLLADLTGRLGPGAAAFVTELAWREFYADVLWHHPASLWEDLTPALAGIRYDESPHLVERWRQGTTGFPIVDAGMRQLLATGWMHNRVRMITASFLCKDLHVWWPVGARHFLDRLLDADPASNNHGWQWVAGTGTDAAPYFRVFNPVLQGLKFDPDGSYVRRFLPELAHLPGRAAHEPWRFADGYACGYPGRIVDHAAERAESLSRYAAARSGRARGESGR